MSKSTGCNNFLDFLKDIGSIILCIILAILYVPLIIVVFVICIVLAPVVIVGYPIVLIIEACEEHKRKNKADGE